MEKDLGSDQIRNTFGTPETTPPGVMSSDRLGQNLSNAGKA